MFFKKKKKNENEALEMLVKEIEKREKIIEIYQQYIRLFHSYYNEDWNRNNPFSEIIEIGQIFILDDGLNLPYNLETIVKDIPISDKDNERLINVFGEYWEKVSLFPLVTFLLLMADLKSYIEGSKENDSKSPKEFLEDAIYTKIVDLIIPEERKNIYY